MKSVKDKKKGFTLIELLAIIVILVVILLIAVPKITGYIANSRKSAFYTSVHNLVDNIKPENVLEDKDYCMYNYDEDKNNKTELIKKMYVLAHMENGKIIYSVYARSDKDDVINISDFTKTNGSKTDTWISDDAQNTYMYEISLLYNEIKNGNSDNLNLYVPCGVSK